MKKCKDRFYSRLYNNSFGTLVADLYIAWSYYFDALNDFNQVEAIFQKGFDAGAQPIKDLVQAHDAFRISKSRRMLENVDPDILNQKNLPMFVNTTFCVDDNDNDNIDEHISENEPEDTVTQALDPSYSYQER